MKIPAAKIEMAVSAEESRYTLQAIKLDTENKCFVATDGHILACVPAEVSADDHSVLIGLDTWKQLRAIAKQNKYVQPEVATNGKVTVESAGCKSEFPLAEGQYPNWQAVKPKMDSPVSWEDVKPEMDAKTGRYRVGGPLTIGIDAALLLKLAQAISENNTSKRAIVKLVIKDDKSGVGVQVSGSDAWGVIMPVRT